MAINVICQDWIGLYSIKGTQNINLQLQMCEKIAQCSLGKILNQHKNCLHSRRHNVHVQIQIESIQKAFKRYLQDIKHNGA